MNKVTHDDIVSFANQKVNLPAEDAKKYRKQVNDLLDRLAEHIKQNPGFALLKMLHAGSVAKGTALIIKRELDAAVYVKKEDAPVNDKELVPWIAQLLRDSNPNMKPGQFDDSQPHCVTVRFKGSGLDVDVVPVLYEGGENDMGYLVNKYSGNKTLTSIPLHLEFIRARKKNHPIHYAQVVRLVKWWAKQRKIEDESFKCKSFMIELIVAHLADGGLDLSDYPIAIESVFNYIVTTNLEKRIIFEDYYEKSLIPNQNMGAIEIFDPVNPKNNITEKYTVSDQERLVSLANEAGDAIAEALYADTKQRAVECWQRLFGPTFII